MKITQTRKIAITGLMIALAYVSLYIIRVPIIPSASFLRFDIKDVFIAIIGLLFGPMYAFAGAFLQMFSVSEYGLIGLAMNILSVSSFTVPLAYIYNKTDTNKRILIGLVIGCISMIIAMLL